MITTTGMPSLAHEVSPWCVRVDIPGDRAIDYVLVSRAITADSDLQIGGSGDTVFHDPGWGVYTSHPRHIELKMHHAGTHSIYRMAEAHGTAALCDLLSSLGVEGFQRGDAVVDRGWQHPFVHAMTASCLSKELSDLAYSLYHIGYGRLFLHDFWIDLQVGDSRCNNLTLADIDESLVAAGDLQDQLQSMPWWGTRYGPGWREGGLSDIDDLLERPLMRVLGLMRLVAAHPGSGPLIGRIGVLSEHVNEPVP
jgi:hypothetical protein